MLCQFSELYFLVKLTYLWPIVLTAFVIINIMHHFTTLEDTNGYMQLHKSQYRGHDPTDKFELL